jgi:SAM-dependent methyltransferase
MSACPICTSSESRKIWALKGSRTGNYSPLYYCPKCNFYYQRPDFHEDDKTLRSDLHWHIEQIPRIRDDSKKSLELILKYHPSAKNLLDIGCGIGTTLCIASDLGLKVQGIEPNPHAVKYAKENLPFKFVEGYFGPGSVSCTFDIIILDMVLEHVPELRALIKEIFKALNPGGILFLSVPNRKGGILRILYSMINRSGYKSLFSDNDVHINHFSRKSIDILLEQHGGRILHEVKAGTYIVRNA